MVVVTTAHYIGVAIGGVILVGAAILIRFRMKGGLVYENVAYPKNEEGRTDGGVGGYGLGDGSSNPIAQKIGWPDEQLRSNDSGFVVEDEHDSVTPERGTFQETRDLNVGEPGRKTRRLRFVNKRKLRS